MRLVPVVMTISVAMPSCIRTVASEHTPAPTGSHYKADPGVYQTLVELSFLERLFSKPAWNISGSNLSQKATEYQLLMTSQRDAGGFCGDDRYLTNSGVDDIFRLFRLIEWEYRGVSR